MSRLGGAHVFALEFVWTEHPARGLPARRGRRNGACSLRGLFLRSLLVDAAKRHRESRIGRVSAATQDRGALCRFAVGAASPVGSASDACPSRAGTRAREEHRRRGAEERDQKASGADNSSPGAPRSRATKSILGICFVPLIWLPPLVLIVASPIGNGGSGR